ncbi:TRAP transporter small permease subunit [Thioalkalivibrio sp. HK1]|uniref:TRAP transporter small permease subunit n=1 Tax=Thioalkalivibrio sp. HK1 TaxID=1469245 RepID=UPI0004B9D613|nr:TRAP transporter small permease subunit [Thioalkalivibrio sp. HK1]
MSKEAEKDIEAIPAIDSLDTTDEMIAERRQAPGVLPDDMAPWMRIGIAGIDLFSLWCGRIFCWMLVPLMFAMVFEVVARKLFIAPTIWAYDTSRMLSGALFMAGAGYALMRGVHIRADFIYRLWAPRHQAMVDALLYLLFFFPAMGYFLWISLEYAGSAWISWELSMDTAWMAPVAPVRTAMPVGAAFLILQGISELLKCIYAMRTNRWP